MAEKIISGDSLQNEFVAKFNGMVDEVNELKESGGGGGSGGSVDIVELSGERGTLTNEQYLQCTNPTTVIKWFNGSGAHIVYEYWRYVSPTIYFRSVYIDADECINNIIEIIIGSHGWKRTQATYDAVPKVSVTQTLTSGTKIGAITVDGKTTALYAPEGGGSGGGGSVPADAIIDVDKLPSEENAYLFQNGAKVEEYLMRKVVVRIVETLPDVGELFLTSTSCNIYYQKGDDEAYCYLTPDVPPGGNFTGWANLSSGFGWVSDFGYGGVITDEIQATDTSRKYFVYNAGEYINTKAFYRVSTPELGIVMEGVYLPNGAVIEDVTVNIFVVDTLPDISELTPNEFTYYLQLSDNDVYFYPAEEVGMMKISDMFGDYWGGIVSSKDQATDSTKAYGVYNPNVTPKLYHYKDGWHEIGGGSGASVLARFEFLQPTKDAEGETSSANGYDKIPINEASMAICTNLFAYINTNKFKITNVQLVSHVGIICPVTVVGSMLYCSFSNLGISHEYLSQLELSEEGYIKMKSDDLVAAFVAAGFTIVVTIA